MKQPINQLEIKICTRVSEVTLLFSLAMFLFAFSKGDSEHQFLLTIPVVASFILRILCMLLKNSMNKEYSSKTNVAKKSPASLLLKIIDLLPMRYRRSLEQEISDMRLEYFEALSEKKLWRARGILVFYYIGLGWSVVMWISDKAKEVVGIIPKKD